ncbi:hypothetical protein [Nostoc sp. FACHB-888]|uniref:hypothetical protein n=1 Tax=Nostoc sp. FACHB-888 TaxID=2692842 RepID=UPI0016894D97|nr:hypothetical protein [Nostoc sp. FACHB-888]MBD2247250.1 hypothetical protein [Nostoc sp. FACHB-888]
MNILNNGELKIYKQTKVLIDEICNYERLCTLSREKINADVAMAITEIVSIYMRDIAKQNDFSLSEKKLVEQAVSKANAIFKQKLLNTEFETYYTILDKYLEIARQDLTRKPSSSNKSSFAKSIVDTKRQELPQNIDILETDSSIEVAYDFLLCRLLEFEREKLSQELEFKKLNFIKVGFNNYIEGLLIYPELEDVEEYTINISNLPQEFNVKVINNFPVEIYHEDYVYIIDDDGTIFVNVENLNSESFFMAGRLLIELAMALYG